MMRIKSQEIWIRVSPKLKDWCLSQAKEDGRTLSGWIKHQLELLRKKSK